jgi:hypothetical protein
MTKTHRDIHAGVVFSASYMSPDAAPIADNASIVMHLLTGSIECDLVFAIAAGGDCEVQFYEAPTLIANGGRIDVHNLHRDSTNESLVSVWQGSTFTGGVLLTNFLVPGGVGVAAIGSKSRIELGRVLAINTIYMIVGVNRSGGVEPMSIIAEWREEE